MPQITIARPDGSKSKFNLANWDQGRAFLREFIFSNDPGFPDDKRLIRATHQTLHEHNFGSGWRRHHLADIRRLPARIVHSLHTPQRETCLPLTMLLEDLVGSTAREFRSQTFWQQHGMNQTLLGRREIEELEAALVELEPNFNSDDEELNAAGFTIRQILATLRDPSFTKFSRVLPLPEATAPTPGPA
jgi:hypothetical protein